MNATSKKHPIIDVENVVKTFAGVTALNNLSLSFTEGEITALVGDNGAGKSTFIKCLSGLQPPDSGRISMDGEEVSISTTPATPAAMGSRRSTRTSGWLTTSTSGRTCT